MNFLYNFNEFSGDPNINYSADQTESQKLYISSCKMPIEAFSRSQVHSRK